MRTLRQLILEEKCPYCGNPKAYVGMRDVECPNKKCKGFSQRQADDTTPKHTQKRLAIELDHTDDDAMGPDGMDIPKLVQSVSKLAKKYDCAAIYLPGFEPGGHPVFRIVGTQEHLFDYVVEYCDGDKEDAKDMLDKWSEEALIGEAYTGSAADDPNIDNAHPYLGVRSQETEEELRARTGTVRDKPNFGKKRQADAKPYEPPTYQGRSSSEEFEHKEKLEDEERARAKAAREAEYQKKYGKKKWYSRG